MDVHNKTDADHRERKGLVSHARTPLAVTWVTVEPGARRQVYHHPEIQGGGVMQVGEERQPECWSIFRRLLPRL